MLLTPTTDSHSSVDDRLSCLVVSLDFELYWGVRHERTVQQYTKNLVGARKAIPAILSLFKEFNIHATWAVVGMVLCDSTRTLLQHAPTTRPRYRNKALSPYYDLPPHDATEVADSIFFAPSLVRLIANTEGQEIATHSFSHYYCLEPGQDCCSFREDLSAALRIARSYNLNTRTLVFPKNQCRTEYLDICADLGILAYRGNPSSRLYAALADSSQGYLRRLARLLDAYMPLTGPHCYLLSSSEPGFPINIPASRYLRPYLPALRPFEPFRLRRITRALTIAAKQRLTYHLWWHPHNFGSNLDANLAFLRRILSHYGQLREQYGIESLNMGEITQRLCPGTQNIPITNPPELRVI